jgi:predicted nucleic acid-binding protein
MNQQKKYRLYLDNCCFNRPFDNQKQLKIKLETEAKLFIQHEILIGKHELVWSYILEFENNQNPYRDRREAIQDWKSLANMLCVESDKIIEFAETLFNKGIKVKDALHIACAVDSKADFFITTDKGLLNKHISEINIVNPLTIINELNS